MSTWRDLFIRITRFHTMCAVEHFLPDSSQSLSSPYNSARYVPAFIAVLLHFLCSNCEPIFVALYRAVLFPLNARLSALLRKNSFTFWVVRQDLDVILTRRINVRIMIESFARLDSLRWVVPSLCLALSKATYHPSRTILASLMSCPFYCLGLKLWL